jgi:beta-galactosidase
MAHRSGITRREFLKWTTVSAAVALTFPAVRKALPAEDTLKDPAVLLANWEYCQGALGGAWDVWRTDPGNTIEWQPVRVPHSFNARDAVDPDHPYYQGPGWYRTNLRLVNPFSNGRSVLHFEGAGQRSAVFVHLDKVAEHIGGYDEFVVDITEPAAKAVKNPANLGSIPVAVLCDNSRDLDMIPSSLNDFCRYGGLYRRVSLVYLPAISLDQVHIDTRIDSSQSARVSVRASLYNPTLLTSKSRISISVFDPQNALVKNSTLELAPWQGKREFLSFELPAPQLWSLAKPSLYRCEATLENDHGQMTLAERFGLRHFEFVPHGPFKLNGERILLKGTQREEDHAGFAAAMNDDLIEKELKLIKDMGVNFLGLAHHQQSRTVLDLCDELGLLVLEAVPWSRGGLGGEPYQRQARNMLRAMIEQHYNHPSIILWGLGNENDWPGDFPEFDKEKIRTFMKELNDLAHTLDPSRSTFLRRCDFCKDLVDVYSPSIWAGWYHGPYTNYRPTCQGEMQKVNHFLHVEWGAEAHAGRHSEDIDRLLAKALLSQSKDARELDYLLAGGQDRASENGDWSETYACNLFDWHLKEQLLMPWLTGSAHWIFKDFATPLRAHNPVPYVNQKGLVERDMTPKEGYYVFQSYWADEPMIHIYGHSWPVRWGELGEKKLIKVYSNCETVELFLNGVSWGARKRNIQDFPSAGLRWLVTLKPGENHVRVLGHKNSNKVSDEIRFQYQTERWGKPTKLELREKTRTGMTVTVEARVLDTNDAICLDARDRVRFGITGAGTLLDNTGTSTGSRSIELYNGRAEIRSRTDGGKSVVSVTSKGLLSAFLALA